MTRLTGAGSRIADHIGAAWYALSCLLASIRPHRSETRP